MMKYRKAILYFAGVTVLALLARISPPTGMLRQIFTVVAVVSFVGGILGFEMHAGWTSQKAKRRSRNAIVAALAGAALVALVVYSVFLSTEPSSEVMLAVGLIGMFCVLFVFRSAGALVASRAQKRKISEQRPGE